MWDRRYIEELNRRRQEAYIGGGNKRIDEQHAKGKLTARERVEALFDANSFVEIETLVESRSDEFGMSKKRIPGDGVIIGYGLIDGRTVYASIEDFTVMGGTLGEYHSKKICHIIEMAVKMRAPYVSINDSGGARIEEGISSLDGYSGMFFRNTMASGLIPQIAVMLGPCAGGACYSPAIMDYIFMSKKAAKMFITGPNVVKSATGESISADDLGGALPHTTKSGVVHFAYDDDKSCLQGVKKLLSYLPSNCNEKPPFDKHFKGVDDSYRIQEIVPDNQKQIYDVKEVIETFIDRDSFFEIQEGYAKNIIIAFARLDGEVIGIIANQPMFLAGALDIASSEKAARFIRFCDCFNIPILTLEDVPGFFPGSKQEHDGIIRRGAKLLYAYAEATVPKITLIMRKAFGGAYIAMNSKGMGADVVFAWPIAQTAVMGAEGAVDIIYHRQIEKAPDPNSERERLIGEYEKHYMVPYIAAQRGFIDEVIQPDETRKKLSDSFRALKYKNEMSRNRKHGNIPL
ncbi:MAG: acyl-CoA carboxylase subunit beta [Pseudobutyrivibrio sp.]|nr:acyl-CoA carboxylase subunit beta [Pseudobutyrivibrio sp.]